jgi:lipoyl synthase
MQSKIPGFIKTRLASKPKIVQENSQKLKKLGLATVCQEAKCPNIGECWSQNTATFMVMGDTCTRGCKFCHVKTGMPEALDKLEPYKVAIAIKKMQLDYVVITSVDRDELEDQGANHFAQVILKIKEYCPNIKIEVLIPDFKAKSKLLDIIIEAKPEVIAHNIETTELLTPKVRDIRAKYKQSLDVLEYIKTKSPKIISKTSIMLGLGETSSCLEKTFKDLANIKLDMLTLGQYLQPSAKQLAVTKYYHPEEYVGICEKAQAAGIKLAEGFPLMRSSYKANEYYKKLIMTTCN